MLNNRRQSIGPRPDSRPHLEGARYKYLTNCSCLLSRTSPFSHAHTHTHIINLTPPLLGEGQWVCYTKASVYESRVGWTPARRNNNNNNMCMHLCVCVCSYGSTCLPLPKAADGS